MRARNAILAFVLSICSLIWLLPSAFAQGETTTRCGMELGQWVCCEQGAQPPNAGSSSVFDSFMRGFESGQQVNPIGPEPPIVRSELGPRQSAQNNSAQTPMFYAKTVQELMAVCRRVDEDSRYWTDVDAIHFAVCFNVIDGLTSGATAAANAAGVAPIFCLPNGSTVGQRVSIFMKWAEDHPETWHEGPIFGVFSAMSDAFNCEGE